MAASATFALKAAVWFRRGRRCMVSPDSRATACPPSGRNSTYRPVQISGASSDETLLILGCHGTVGSAIAAAAGPRAHEAARQPRAKNIWTFDATTDQIEPIFERIGH